MPYFKSAEWQRILRIAEQWKEQAKWYVGDRQPVSKDFGVWTDELVRWCDEHTHLDSGPLWELYTHATDFASTTGRRRKPTQQQLDSLAAKVIGVLDRLHNVGTVAKPPTVQPAIIKPLTEAHQAAYDLICKEGPLLGKHIVNRLDLTSESLFTGKYVPELKKHGISNRPGLGYYHPDFYRPGPPKPVGKR